LTESFVRRTELYGAQRQKKKRRVVKIVVLILAVMVVATGIIAFRPIKIWAAKHYLRLRLESVVINTETEPDAYDELAKWHDPSQPFNILAVGIDKGSNPGETGYTRSDVMLVVSIDLMNKKVAVVSIPRDTKVQIPGYGTEKINAAHSYGGPKLVTTVVKEFAGLDIHAFVRVDFQAFQSIVDAIGGVPFTLPYDIKDDKAGYLYKGHYDALTGEMALTLVRSRNLPNGDLDRIENQHNFLKALMEKMSAITDKQKLIHTLDATIPYLETTMSPDQIITVAECMQGITADDVEMATVPGTAPTPAPGAPWYFLADPLGTQALFDNVRLYTSVVAPGTDLPRDAAGNVNRALMKVKVLNGGNKTGAGNTVAQQLITLGYPNPNPGTTKYHYAFTAVYYAAGLKQYGEQVAADLDPNRTFLVEQGEQVTHDWGDVPVVVVLGDDY